MSEDLGDGLKAGDLYIKDKAGKFVSLGKVVAFRIELKNGKKYVMGSPEARFDLELTESDKALLANLQIKDK